MSASHALLRARTVTGTPLPVSARRASNPSRVTSRGRRAVRIRAASGPIVVTVTVSGKLTACEIPGTGGLVGSGAGCACVVKSNTLSQEHCKLEVRQGRIFVTDVSGPTGNGVFLGKNKLFPGIAYPVPENSEVRLGNDVALRIAQVDGGAGPEGVDMMSKMMQMQFEQSLSPEIKKAMEE